ncbi:MAG: hypothetical protein RR461_05765, partial [Angelakisella sp.]
MARTPYRNWNPPKALLGALVAKLDAQHRVRPLLSRRYPKGVALGRSFPYFCRHRNMVPCPGMRGKASGFAALPPLKAEHLAVKRHPLPRHEGQKPAASAIYPRALKYLAIFFPFCRT